MAPPVQCLVASALAASVACARALACLPHAIPEVQRINVTKNVPFGLFLNQWDSSDLVTEVAKVLISEALGYNVVFSGTPATTGLSDVLAVSGCTQDEGPEGVKCGIGPLPDDHPHHASLENWNVFVARFGAVNSKRRPEVLPIGYVGREGMYVPGVPLSQALTEHGVHLEFYGAYDLRWNEPWQFFMEHTSINVSLLMPCSESNLGNPIYMADVVYSVSPDPEGFDTEGRAKCSDGYWWLSPACRANASMCIPWITGGIGFSVNEFISKAIAYHIPLAVAVAVDWDTYASLPTLGTMLLYTWEPALQYIGLDAQKIIFPRADGLMDGWLAASEDIVLTKVIAANLAGIAPRAYWLVSKMTLTILDIRSLMLSYSAAGSYAKAACDWLKNTTMWTDWVLDETTCSVGQGLVDSLGEFLDNLTDAQACSPCLSGSFSAPLPGTGTYVCRPCEPGTSQPMWGMRGCAPCATGEYQDKSGQSSCHRCERGSYASVSQNSGCIACPPGKTTDGTGFSDADDCQCPANAFLSLVDGCADCGKGASCPGFGTDPEALPGYQLVEVLRDRLRIVLCDEPGFCPGGALGTCAAGRTGLACGLCEEGLVPANGGTCVPCTGGDIVLVSLLVVLIIGLLIAIYIRSSKGNQSRQSAGMVLLMACVAQVIGVCQMMSVISRIPVTWEEPLKSIMRIACGFSLDIDIVCNIGCVASFDPAGKYAIKLALFPIGCVLLTLIHTVFCIVYHSGRVVAKRHKLISAVGVLVLGLYISICSQVFLPFQCKRHPGGDWTVLRSTTVLCWKSASHLSMTAAAWLAFVIPLGALAMVARLLYVMPKHVAQGDVVFLNTFAFLLNKVSVDKRWFLMFHVVRSLMIAIAPTIPNCFWQSFILAWIFVTSAVLVFSFWPWKANAANILDFVSSLVMLCLVMISIAFLQDPVLEGLSSFCVAMLLFLLLCLLCAFIGSVSRLFLPEAKRFDVFVCHQKAGAGAFARMLKLTFCELEPSTHVFLDSDDLHDLATLFASVRHQVKILTVLCSREILFSGWCLGEITTASLYGVLTVPVHFQDFVPPDDALISNMSSYALLTEHGLSLPDVQKAVRWLMSLRPFLAPQVCFEAAVRDLAVSIFRVRPLRTSINCLGSAVSMIRSSSLRTSSKGKGSAPRTSVIGRCRHVILADFAVLEVAASARIYQKLMRQLIVQDGLPLASLPEVIALDINVDDVDSEGVMAVICSPGCFASTSFLLSLMSLVACGIKCVIPVVCSDDFLFPTAAFYAAVEEKTRLLCCSAGVQEVPRMLCPFLESMFKKICARLSTKSSMDVLRLEVSRMYMYYKTDATLSGYLLDLDTLQHMNEVVKNQVVPGASALGMLPVDARTPSNMSDASFRTGISV